MGRLGSDSSIGNVLTFGQLLDGGAAVDRTRNILKQLGAQRAPAQGMIEYGLIIALVAVVAVAGVVILSPTIGNLIASIEGK